MKALGELLGCGEPVGLHRRGRHSSQARGFQRMGGQHGAVSASMAGFQLGLQLRVCRNGIERVRIQDGPRGRGKHPGDDGFYRFPASAAAHDDLFFQIQRFRRAEHEFRLLGVHAGAIGAQQGHENPACPGMQRSAGSQQGCASHVRGGSGSGLAANHGNITKAALVTGLRSLHFSWLAGAIRAQQPGVGRAGGELDAELVKPYFTGEVFSAGGEQTGFQCQQT